MNDLNIGVESSFFPQEKISTVDPVFNIQNDRVVTFGNAASEHGGVSTAKFPASIMMLGVVASNGRRCLQFGLE